MTKLLLFFVLTGVLCHASDPNSRIVGGGDATYGEHPYMCSLQYKSWGQFRHICGCVIYNQNTAMTAAHCLDGFQAGSLRVVAGLHRISNKDEYEVIKSVSTFKMHPNYSGNGNGYPNDIGVIKLSSPLEFNSHITSIAMDEDRNNSWVGQQCQLTGWGRLSGWGSLPNTLQTVSITKISNENCTIRWSGISGASINDGHICFYEPGKSACNGDSGGPVRCGDTITGVTSWGISSCSGAYPSVYTRISYFADWLRNNAY